MISVRQYTAMAAVGPEGFVSSTLARAASSALKASRPVIEIDLFHGGFLRYLRQEACVSLKRQPTVSPNILSGRMSHNSPGMILLLQDSLLWALETHRLQEHGDLHVPARLARWPATLRVF